MRHRHLGEAPVCLTGPGWIIGRDDSHRFAVCRSSLPHRDRRPRRVAVFPLPLGLRRVEELSATRIAVSHETIRQWAPKFGQTFANRIRASAAGRRQMAPKIAGKKQWLWRAIDRNGLVLDILMQSRGDRNAAKWLPETVDSSRPAPNKLTVLRIPSSSDDQSVPRTGGQPVAKSPRACILGCRLQSAS
jgi:hypothetical protein